MTGKRLVGALACAAFLLLPACGDSGGADPSADRSAARAATDALEQRLRNDGFEVAPADDEDDDEVEFETEECRRFAAAFPDEEDDVELEGETASVESDELERGELNLEGGVAETVQGFVYFVEKPEVLDPFFELLGDQRLGDCVGEVFRTEAKKAAEEGGGVELRDLRVEQLESDLGEDSAGVGLTGTLAVEGFTFPLAIELEFVREGRGVAGIAVSAVGGELRFVRGPLLELMLDEMGG